MWYRLELASDELQRLVNNMDSQQWVVVSIVALVCGAIFLRGFGSRTGY
jgi:hypothetical protein